MLPMSFFLLPVSAAELHTTEQEDTLLEGMLATCLRHLPYIQGLSPHSVELWDWLRPSTRAHNRDALFR